ncbi:MAG: hydrogenase [Acidimicrobiales bacterium]
MTSLGTSPTTLNDAADVVALLVLLSEFAMLRSSLSRSQVRLYAFQSLCVSILAGFVAATRHIVELYGLMGMSFLLKVIVVPLIIVRLVKEIRVDVTASHRIGVATMVLLAIVLSVFGVFVVGHLPVHSRSLPILPLALAAAVILVSFLLVIVRNDVVSQAIGFFSLENGVSVASLVLAAGLPLIVELAFLFDLLVAVVVFCLLMRVHHGRTGTLSTQALDRLRG